MQEAVGSSSYCYMVRQRIETSILAPDMVKVGHVRVKKWDLGE